MASYTQNKGLELPTTPEHYDINIFNKNAMVIDSELHKLDLKNQSQDNLLATKEALNAEISRVENQENEIVQNLSDEITRAKSAENGLSNDINNEVDRATTAEMTINDNLSLLISELTTRLNALADSDDTTLDQLSEIVTYIKNNKTLIDGITTSKVSVSDIIDNLTSTATDKPLSANQGKILKELINSLTKSDIGLGNVENKSSETIRSELTKENVITALGYTPSNAQTTQTLTGVKGNAESSYRTGNVNLTPANIGAVAKSGDTMTGQLIVQKGIKIHSCTAREGSSYLKLATLKISGSYTDAPISLEITRRFYKTTCKLFIVFTAMNSSDPSLNSFLADSISDYGVYIHKSATSIWDLYVTCPRYDQVDVISFNMPKQCAGISVYWKDENVTSIPSGAIKANLLTAGNNGITYSDSQPTSLTAGMTWIGN